MKTKSTISVQFSLVLLFCIVLINRQLSAQQVADSTFSTKVEHPAYVNYHPKVLIDEAHANFHTMSGRYKPFADLIMSDGYNAFPNKDKFTNKTLKGYKILVIANALGSESVQNKEWSSDWILNGSKPAFSAEECNAVHKWIRKGGALLLIADHPPFGVAAADIANTFDVNTSKGYTWDEANSPGEFNNPGVIIYSKENGMLSNHPIIDGRNKNEQINRIIIFVGQSLQGPQNSEAFLKLAPTAIDIESLRESAKKVSAAGRAQGIAFKFGRGRVIVLGEAAMITAQAGGTMKFGMNYPGFDNKQLALNIMHWLSGLLK